MNDLIDAAGFHPVTSLTSLTGEQKRLLLDKGVVSCRDVDISTLRAIGLNEATATTAFQETAELCRRKSVKSKT